MPLIHASTGLTSSERSDLEDVKVDEIVDEAVESEEQTAPDNGNDDAVLRWNACARMVNNNPAVKPGEEQARETMLE